MGCDIHLYVEKKQKIYDVEQWVNIDNWRVNPYFKPGNDEGERPLEHRPVYRDRNYRLFAVLANVRSDEDSEPICEPKGEPEDMSPVTRSEWKQWDGDGHSHSYFTMRELLEAQKKQTVKKFSGMLKLEQAKKLDEGIFPTSWCGWTNMEGYVERKWEMPGSHLDSLMEALLPVYEKEYWIYDHNRAERFDKELDNFRIVFWFDN